MPNIKNSMSTKEHENIFENLDWRWGMKTKHKVSISQEVQQEDPITFYYAANKPFSLSRISKWVFIISDVMRFETVHVCKNYCDEMDFIYSDTEGMSTFTHTIRDIGFSNKKRKSLQLRSRKLY